jgi:hypothetical protein
MTDTPRQKPTRKTGSQPKPAASGGGRRRPKRELPTYRLPLVDTEAVLRRHFRDYPSGEEKGYLPWKPNKRTAQIRADIRTVLLQYGDYWPLGPRQIGYVLIGGYGYTKTDEHFRKVIYILRRGRRANYVSISEDGEERSWWDAVADGRTPDPLTPPFFASPQDFIDNVLAWAESYSCDLQDGQPVRIVIWVETASLAPQVARVAHLYGVPVYPSSGEVAILAKLELALQVARWAKDGIQTVVLQVGDFDGKGVAIFRVMEADVCSFAQAHGADGMVTFERLAVTREQVERYGLDKDPVKISEDGSPPPGPPLPFDAQAEALNPEQLAEVVEGGIRTYQDSQVRATAQSRSERERRIVLDAIQGIDVPA